MEWLRFALFESPLTLALAGSFGCFWLLVWWRRGGSVRPLLAGLLLLGAGFVMQALVETRRETAIRILDGIERDTIAGRVQVLKRVLAAGFRAGELDREGFVALARATLERTRVEWIRGTAIHVIESDSSRFAVRAAYLCDVTTDGFRGAVQSLWRIEFRRADDTWQLSGVELLQLNGQKVSGWREITP